METNLSFFCLPVTPLADSSDPDYKNKSQEICFDYLHPLPSHGSLLGTDDVFAQFLSSDDPLEEPDLNGPTTLHCEICKKKFDNAKKYYGHLRVHSKDKVWVCENCTKRFSTKQQLMKHSLTHKPLDRVWQCPQCSMAFEYLWRLQQHMFSQHLNYRPHKCDVCPKSFHKLCDLKKHKDIHSNIKKHQCSVCEMKFTHKSNLNRHMVTHGNKKPFPCPACGIRYCQVASMRRHLQRCPHNQKLNQENAANKNTTVQFKTPVTEYIVRPSTAVNPPATEPEKDAHQMNIDANRTVDNIVDDILSVEDDYNNMKMKTQNEIMNAYNQTEDATSDNTDNLMQIELLKDMYQMHMLDDELFYNDLDFDNFQTIYNMNTNDLDDGNDKNTELFDMGDGNKSIDQDIMNALCQVKTKYLPEELLNPPVLDAPAEQASLLSDPASAVNGCATIFESDVDLEASSNLAANLNQLIGENNVQYISTEHDDTFIISLNSEIDAEQLTDLLNIGVELVENKNANKTEEEDRSEVDSMSNAEPIVLKIPEPVSTCEEDVKENKTSEEVEDNKEAKKKKSSKVRVLFLCRTCNKIFKKRDNYRSHIATHDASLRRHKCRICSERFSYKSTLNKHVLSAHTPRVAPAHACDQCTATYTEQWMLNDHVKRTHARQSPHACDHPGCGKAFFKKCDLTVHKRYHSGERPYTCEVCRAGFPHPSHLKRHRGTRHCAKRAKNSDPASLM